MFIQEYLASRARLMNPAAAVADVHHVGVYRLRFMTSAATFPGKSSKLV